MKTFISIVTCLLVTVIYAQAPEIEWQKSLGGSDSEYLYSIQLTSDDGYILIGEGNSNDGDISGNHGKADVWVVKMNDSGNIEWQKSLGGSEDDFGQSIESTSDGGYIISGPSQSSDGDVSNNQGETDVWIAKLSDTGEIQWQKSLGGSGVDAPGQIKQTSDGGYIATGITGSNDGDISGNHGDTDALIVKLDHSGNIEWLKTLGGSNTDWLKSILQTSDGGYIFTGTSLSNDGDVNGNHGGSDAWIVKLNQSGNIEWQKSFGGSNDDFSYSIQSPNEGGFIIAGNTGSNDGDVSGNHGYSDYWVVKLDDSGNMEWQKTLGGSLVDKAYSIMPTTDGGYLVGGHSNSNDGDVSGHHGTPQYIDYWIVKLNQLGNIEWQKALGGDSHEYSYTRSILQTPDGGFMVAGESSSNNGDVSGNHGEFDFWAVKLSPENMGITEINTKDEFLVYPNPVDDFINIHSKNQLIDVVEILDMTGNIWMHQKLNSLNAKLNIAQLPKGIFIVKLKTQNNTVTRKIIKK